MPLPPCVASMVQVPGLVNEAVVPDTVHIPVVSEAKLTVRLEVDVAERPSCVPCVWLAMGLKVMVWDSALLVNEKLAVGVRPETLPTTV